MESSTALLGDRLPVVAPAAERAEPSAPRRGLVARVGAGRLVLVVLAVAIAGGAGYLRAWPPLATVMSGSMSPTIDTGDVVVMKRIDGAPRVGDVIAVTVPDEARSRYGYPPEVIHRVIRVAPDGRITTKGDARRQPDPFTVRREAVDTRVVATVPAAGRALAFLTSTLGLVWLGMGALLLIVLPLFDRQRELQQAEQEGIEELGTDLQAVLEEVVYLRAQVDADGRAREDLEQTLRELNASTAALHEQLAAALAVDEPVDAPEPDSEAEPEPAARRRSGGLVGRARDRARVLRG